MTTHSASPIHIVHVGQSAKKNGVVGERYLAFICVCLLGYAVLGKLYAYAGVPPFFIGEFALLMGVIVFFRLHGWTRLLQAGPVWPLLGLMGFCILRTLPFISVYGLMALRDATVYGYAIFALVVCLLIQDQPSRVALLLRKYAAFIPIFVGIMPILAVLHRFMINDPTVPWATDVKIISLKESDVMVHLGGVLAFWIVGFAGEVSWGWIALMLLTAGLCGLVDRSGMVAYLFCAIVGLALRPRSRVPWRLLALVALGLIMMWVVRLHIELPGGKGREISVDQVAENLASVTGGDTGSDSLDSTKEWRVDWWNTIVGYTVHGPYRWTGKGFGINLADDDGFRLDEDGTLRSPHSVHMTFLARTGVPGLALWIVTQLTWIAGVVGGYLRARRLGDLRWQGVFLFLGCYWGAFLINASFDVFLEGPMGGIWFWVIFGVGMGAVWVFDHCPEALPEAFRESWPEAAR
jgi:hypothetical protein